MRNYFPQTGSAWPSVRAPACNIPGIYAKVVRTTRELVSVVNSSLIHVSGKQSTSSNQILNVLKHYWTHTRAHTDALTHTYTSLYNCKSIGRKTPHLPHLIDHTQQISHAPLPYIWTTYCICVFMYNVTHSIWKIITCLIFNYDQIQKMWHIFVWRPGLCHVFYDVGERRLLIRPHLIFVYRMKYHSILWKMNLTLFDTPWQLLFLPRKTYLDKIKMRGWPFSQINV